MCRSTELVAGTHTNCRNVSPPKQFSGSLLRTFILGARPKLRVMNGLNATLYPIADAILKIGRYIAITINPITTPRNTIIIGSSSAVSDETA